ncbi:MAG: YdbH domain-containing protein [bacterium]
MSNRDVPIRMPMKPNPKQISKKMRTLGRVLCFCLSVVMIAGVLVWQARITVLTYLLRHELDRRGLSDVMFQLASVRLDRIVLKEVQMGGATPVVRVDWLEARFSFPEIFKGEVDRVRACGIQFSLIAGENTITVPFLERLQKITSSPAGDAGPRPEANRPSTRRFRIGEGSVYQVQMPVRRTDGKVLTTLNCEATLLFDPTDVQTDRYRFRCSMEDAAGVQFLASGRVSPWIGDTQLALEAKIRNVSEVLAVAQAVHPLELPFAVSNCSATARATFSSTAWTNMGFIEGSVELGRGSIVAFPRQESDVILQSFKIDVSGRMSEWQARLNIGLAGVRMKGDRTFVQEEGRMLSLRGGLRFQDLGTNHAVRATMDTALSGRIAAQVLPDFLPFMPTLLTDGGTLHTEATLTRQPKAKWQGQMGFVAEARRTSVTLAAGRVGALRAAVEGSVEFRDNQAGLVKTAVIIEEGSFRSQGQSCLANFKMALTSEPPYQEAVGTFSGRVTTNTFLRPLGIHWVEGPGLAMEGDARVTALRTRPEWWLTMKLPETKVVVDGLLQGRLGGMASVRYGETLISATAETWLRDVSGEPSKATDTALRWGAERLSLELRVPECPASDRSNRVVHIRAGIRDAFCGQGKMAEVQALQMTLPMTWSQRQGLQFPDPPELGWKDVKVGGLAFEATGFTITNNLETVEIRNRIQCKGSQLELRSTVRIPLADPGQATLQAQIPDVRLTGQDAMAAWIRTFDDTLTAEGRCSAEMELRRMDSGLYLHGKIAVAEGRLARQGVKVSGLRAEVPFEFRNGLRTCQTPVVAFERMEAGRFVVNQGEMLFQLTPEEFFIERARVDFCKGQLNTYSIHLNLKQPNADLIVYADRVDLGETLIMVTPLTGKIEGVLYGRFPIKIADKKIHLYPGFLYSLPGQGGTFRLDDVRQIEPWLAQAGIQSDVKGPLAKALGNMDFSTLRMELETPADKGEAVLRLKIAGKSNDKEWPAPVDLNLNLHGPLEKVLNMGINFSQK